MSLLYYRRELDRSAGCAVGWDSNLHPSDSCQLMPGNLTGPTPSHSHCRLKRVQRGHITAGWVTADRFFKSLMSLCYLCHWRCCWIASCSWSLDSCSPRTLTYWHTHTHRFCVNFIQVFAIMSSSSLSFQIINNHKHSWTLVSITRSRCAAENLPF